MKTKNSLNDQDTLPEETIGEIVAKDYRKARVFKKFGIDFCCGGKQTLTEVCRKKGADAAPVRAALVKLDKIVSGPSEDYNQWEIGFLKDYIVNTHHRYIKQSVPFISELARKVARVHGGRHPEAIQVAVIFEKAAQDLNLHLNEEENTLFPYIEALWGAGRQEKKIIPRSLRKIGRQITALEAEHEQVGKDLGAIRTITGSYRLPADACTSYRVLYRSLEEFENDLHKHVHLENNILFPKAIRLEEQLSL